MTIGAAAQDPERGAVEQFIDTIVRQTATACPLTSPADQLALDRCRASLYGSLAFRNGLAPVVLWGRPSPDGRRLRDTNLTQFAPDVLSGLYLPLFMFTGDYEINFRPDGTALPRPGVGLVPQCAGPRTVSVPVLARRQEMGGLPAANEVTLWVDPAKVRVVIMQFLCAGQARPALDQRAPCAAAFDGKWMWTDANGQTQPRPTLFRGLDAQQQPLPGPARRRVQDLAGELRKGTCNECHAPDNSVGMKRLVLMQTPAHAAGEIKRIMRAVRDDKMPLDDVGLYKEMDPAIRAALLRYGAAFEAVVDAARDWEAKNP
jgi:hypothetical protein